MSVTTHLNRRSALTILLSIGMILLIIAVQMARPSKAQNQFAPSFKNVGAMGEPIEMREGTLTVTRLRMGKTLETADALSDETLTTSANWLLVDYRFVPRREKGAMDVTLYSGENARYRASTRPGASATKSMIYGEPGFPQSGDIAFEVPESALPGSRLVIGNAGAFGIPLWDSEAVIPLGIDRARAKRLVDEAPATLTVRG